MPNQNTQIGFVGSTEIERTVRLVRLLQGKWTVRVLFAMRSKPIRLGELGRMIPRASKKGLTSSLRSLEVARIIVRRDLSDSVLHVEYAIRDELQPSIDNLLACLAGHSTLCETCLGNRKE